MPTPNIFSFSGENLLAWTSAYALWEPISYFLFPAAFKAATTQEYYNPKKFPFAIVAFGDYIYSTMIFIVAQVAITSLFGTSTAPNWLEWAKRLGLFLGIQWISDLSFYGFITQVGKVYKNKYIDFFNRYGSQVGIGAPIGDSIYAIIWLLTTQFVASVMPIWSQVFAIATFLFMTLVFSY
jgi:hypothetical protein